MWEMYKYINVILRHSTTVKLHPLKKTTAMNIKFNIGKNKRDGEKRGSNGRNERENDSRKNLHNYYISYILYSTSNSICDLDY